MGCHLLASTIFMCSYYWPAQGNVVNYSSLIISGPLLFQSIMPLCLQKLSTPLIKPPPFTFIPWAAFQKLCLTSSNSHKKAPVLQSLGNPVPCIPCCLPRVCLVTQCRHLYHRHCSWTLGGRERLTWLPAHSCCFWFVLALTHSEWSAGTHFYQWFNKIPECLTISIACLAL